MRVCIVYRDPIINGTSIEEIFKGLNEVFRNYGEFSHYSYQKQLTIWRNVKLLRGKKSTIYHISGVVYLLTYFLWDRKVILTVHDIGRYKELTGLKKWIYKEFLLRGPMILADRITVVSNYTKKDIEAEFGKTITSKIRMIYNPVPELFKRNNKPFNHERPRILQVGTGVNKNLVSVIQSVKGISCVLVIIGNLSDEIRKLLVELKISFENYFQLDYTEVYEQYCLSDIIIFVSVFEGFGMPVLEGQATGRPVVASKTTSIPEVGGMGAHYIDNPMDVEEIKNGIVRITEDDEYRNKLINYGFVNIGRFERTKIAHEYLNLYNEL